MLPVDFVHKARRLAARGEYDPMYPATVESRLPSSNVAISPVVGSTVLRMPVNEQTAMVISASPRWERASSEWRGLAPPALRCVPSNTPDLTGRVVGRLMVVGLSATHVPWHPPRPGHTGSSGRGARWVCRCRCGYYVVRSTKAIRKNSDLACEICLRIEGAERARQRQAYYQQMGRWPDDEQ